MERPTPVDGSAEAHPGVPEGFVPYREPSPFLDRAGPLYERDGDAEAGLVIGLLVLEHHCNRRGFAHGGLLVTLADVALGKTGERRSEPPVSLLTASLAYDFVGVVRRGDWVEARCEFHRTGRELAFANCYLTTGGGVVGRASGVFKVSARLDRRRPA
jgi:acyl-coenzyme A thioesterase 13